MAYCFYIYAHHDPGALLLNGRPDVRYIGGAYGNANRMRDHSATRGAMSTRAWFCEVAALGRKVVRRKLLICSESAMWDDKMEQRVWDAYVAAGHRLLNERPMAWPQGVPAKGSEVSAAHRASDPAFAAECNAKNRAAHKGKKLSPEHCEKISAAMKGKKGKKLSPQHRAALSAAHKGKNLSPEHCAKLKGKKRSPETCAKLSAVKRGKKRSLETCMNISAAMKGKKRGPYRGASTTSRITNSACFF